MVGDVHKKGTLTINDLVNKAKAEEDFRKAGAIALFIGVVRGENPSGEDVEKIEIEAYEEVARDSLIKICEDLKKREGIVDVQIHHFIGEFNVGEDLVYVLVAGSRRENVFPVLVEAVERYKKEAPIFKKEYTVDKEGNIKASWLTEDEI